MKIYKSVFRTYSISVKLNGVKKRVNFVDKGEPFCYGVFVCNDDELAKAIEKSEYFGNTVELLSADEKKEEQPERKYAAVYEDVKRTQEANKILVNEYGVDKDKLNSKADALRLADELNISFPNL